MNDHPYFFNENIAALIRISGNNLVERNAQCKTRIYGRISLLFPHWAYASRDILSEWRFALACIFRRFSWRGVLEGHGYKVLDGSIRQFINIADHLNDR
jgi:hypothetical protein